MRNYEKMDAYKVSFNANEQVAAAACTYFVENGQYDNIAGCLWDFDGTKFTLKADPTRVVNDKEWQVWGPGPDDRQYMEARYKA